MAESSPIFSGSLDDLCSEFVKITRAVQDRRLYQELQDLCQRMETLSCSNFLLHPSKCRCLLQSYALLLRLSLFTENMSPTNVSSSTVPHKFEALLIREFLHTLREGEQFLQNCTSTSLSTNWWPSTSCIVPASPNITRRWLMRKAILIALSTEILDVHLPAFVACIFALVRMVCVASSEQPYLIQKVIKSGLMRIWTSADEDGDVERMQELFSNMKSKVPEGICELISKRLAETQLNLAGVREVPPCLWLDSPRMRTLEVLSSHGSEVVKVELMGERFVCKHFQGAGSLKEFTNEAAIQASLLHANVMQLLWCTRRAESHYLVMELMHEDLCHVIEKRRLKSTSDPPFSLLASIDIMLQIAKGMEYLHDMGIMHRDLKSPNILVRHSKQYKDDQDHRLIVKVADFGLSKVKNNTYLYTSKHEVGTSIWRAPEILNTEDESKYTNKADVYSFAIVCAEILTGLQPKELLPSESMSKLRSKLKQGIRPQLPSSCPTAIADYIKKCWDGDEAKRPTFRQISTVFCGFKACILSGEAELLETSLPAELVKRSNLKASKVKRGLQGMGHETDRTIEMAWYPRQKHQESSLEYLIRRFLLFCNCLGFDRF